MVIAVASECLLDIIRLKIELNKNKTKMSMLTNNNQMTIYDENKCIFSILKNGATITNSITGFSYVIN